VTHGSSSSSSSFFFLKYRTNYGTKNGKEETGPKQVGANPEEKKKKKN
jgi:hypothetical protein